MSKLFIEYRIEDKNNYFKGATYFSFTLENKTTIISIAPNETRLLKELIYGIEKDLQDGYHLEQSEKFDISEFDKQIMEAEESIKHRIDNKTYNLCKMGYQAVIQGKTTFDELIKIMEREVNV